MENLEGKRVLVTGGNRGLGLAIVEALVGKKAQVTVLARDAEQLGSVQKRLNVAVVAGDMTDPALATKLLRDVRPTVLVLNAGASPAMAPIHEQTWEGFSASWNNDVKGAFYWVQEALRLPLPPGTRVLLGSSGAAVAGSPLSGGYAGAKRMLWLMAHYANSVSEELGLGIKFQAIVPRQMIPETKHGRGAAEAYAKRKGVSVETFVKNFGAPMPPAKVAEHVVDILTDPKYASGTAWGLKGDLGIHSLDG
jgi:NAD(P)-dependent dehydrogenase (short-subunit alcohol dehydrogenase family)